MSLDDWRIVKIFKNIVRIIYIADFYSEMDILLYSELVWIMSEIFDPLSQLEVEYCGQH